ncbi:MAG: LysR substrate-binding domain-containing protein [Myxococcota bacterium]
MDEVLRIVAPHLRVFQQQHAHIELHIDTRLRVFSLTRREADVAIRPGRRPVEPDVVARSLVSLSMAAYASPSYLEGRSPVRRTRDLRGHDLLALRSERDEGVFSTLPNPRIVCRTTSMSALAVAARAGMGVAVLPTFIGDHEPGLTRLVRVPAPDDLRLWILIHADLRQTARVRAFVDFMSDAIRASRELFERPKRKGRLP